MRRATALSCFLAAATLATGLRAQHAPILPDPIRASSKAQQPSTDNTANGDRNTAAAAATHNANTELPPLVAWRFVQRGNTAFAHAQALAHKQLQENGPHDHVTNSHHTDQAEHLPAPQTRPAGAGKYVCIVVSCADLELDVPDLLGLARKDVLQLKLAGAFVNPEAVALLDRTIQQHHCTLLIVLSHEHCASLQHSRQAPLDALDRRLQQLEPLAKRQAKSLPVALVHQQRELLLASSALLRDLVGQDRCRIMPAVVNERSGVITWHHRRAQELPLSPVK